jgi:glucose/arabinose dehydrogenase
MRRLPVLLLAVALVAAVLSLTAVTSTPTVAGAGGPPTFTDVATTDTFYPHIVWMGEEGIADGFNDGTFRPGNVVTRAAMAAFLYRAAGEPAFTPPSEPTFTDVPESDPFFHEIEWLADEQITTGFNDGTFRPNQGTNRGAMAAYLYRFSGSPTYTPPGSPSFSDVALSFPFYDEVEWLVDQEVTTGFPDGTYRPGVNVTRASMSAFIFRALHLAPELEINDFVTGATIYWDAAWTPDDAMLYTQRNGTLRARVDGSETNVLFTSASPDMADFYGNGETGLMGLVLDPDFGTNRTFYTCQGENDEGPNPNAQVVAWTVDEDYEVATKEEELINNAEWLQQDGRHGGCRLRFGADGHLWISAGDTACGTYSQNRNVHGGKILRIDEDNPGVAPASNPFVGDGNPNTSDFVYSYGHRNPQGLALRDNGQMFSVEHGPQIDDEVNIVQAGANYGWNPVGPPGPGCRGYNENVPMTDLAEFPSAVPAVWDTDGPTIATSGATFIEGDSWGGWEGGLAVATLNGQHVRVLFFTDSGVFIEQRLPAGLQGIGRQRSPVMGENGDETLYIAGDDQILSVQATPA